MTENLFKTILVRKEEYGGNCSICKQPVELLNNGEPWLEKCRCGTVEAPKWVQIDSYSKHQYRRHFELITVPKETEV